MLDQGWPGGFCIVHVAFKFEISLLQPCESWHYRRELPPLKLVCILYPGAFIGMAHLLNISFCPRQNVGRLALSRALRVCSQTGFYSFLILLVSHPDYKAVSPRQA